MKTFNKTCEKCGIDYVATGPAGRFCEVHAAEAKLVIKERNRIRVARVRAETGKIKKPGVGKGGNPLRGKDNPMYKHGLYVFETIRHEIREEIRNCERCDKDLINVAPSNWCVHHKDHNHWNHVRSNLELLCRRCHAVEHEVHKHFNEGATTIPDVGVGSSDPKS